MRRLTAFLVAPVFLILICILVLVLSGLMVNELKSGRRATLHLKPGASKAGDLTGEVTESDRYVTVRKEDGSEEIYTWDQIASITETDSTSTKKLNRIVDLIDLLSKLGIAATVVFFMVGLYQYGQSQKWEREKFLAAAVKEFIEVKSARNAMHMIDSLALYHDGRWIELFPEADKPENRKVFVSNEEIYEALTPTPHTDLDKNDDRAVTIRDCFDAFLSYMGTFDHYIEQDLITQDALSAHLGYWIELLGPKGSLSPQYKGRIFAYARQYGLTDIESLIQKYQKHSLSERIVSLFMK